MKCSYCSRPNSDNRETCVSCGAPLPIEPDDIARLIRMGYMTPEQVGAQMDLYDGGVITLLSRVTAARADYLDILEDFLYKGLAYIRSLVHRN